MKTFGQKSNSKEKEVQSIVLCVDQPIDCQQEEEKRSSYRRFVKVVIGIIILSLFLVLFGKVGVFMLVFANEQAERRRSALGGGQLNATRSIAAGRKILDGATTTEKCNVRCRFPGDFSGVRFHFYFLVTFDHLCCKQTNLQSIPTNVC